VRGDHRARGARRHYRPEQLDAQHAAMVARSEHARVSSTVCLLHDEGDLGFYCAMLPTSAVRALLVCSMVACTDVSVDVHEAGSCAASWDMYDASAMTCEAACGEPPENYSGSDEEAPCTATHPGSPGITRCDRTFEYDHLRGCCMIADDRVSFWQCE
jgi:hypothetical protein